MELKKGNGRANELYSLLGWKVFNSNSHPGHILTMKFKQTKLKGAFVIDLEKREDERGFFARTWDKDEFEAHGIYRIPVQTNMSFSKKKGTIRGMHYQIAPYQESKVIRC